MNNYPPKVYDLFPTALYSNIYPGDITEIVKYFDSCEITNPSSSTGYGIISKNSYIIDNPVCQPLADWIMKCFEQYATEIMRYKYNKLQFSQSWLTYKYPGQFHKAHTHPNTLLAGVFYYDRQPDDASIVFSKEVKSFNRSYLEPSLLDDYQSHPYSQEEIYYTPQQNEFIIFPSHLTHGVPPNKTNRIRKALGVNILTSGILGDQETISEIIFGRYAN
jgi:uncharacterized protein (TIGR02466 family)